MLLAEYLSGDTGLCDLGTAGIDELIALLPVSIFRCPVISKKGSSSADIRRDRWELIRSALGALNVARTQLPQQVPLTLTSLQPESPLAGWQAGR